MSMSMYRQTYRCVTSKSLLMLICGIGLLLSYFMQASELHLQLLKYSSQLSNCHFPLQLSNTRVVCDEYLTSPYHT